MTIHNNRDGGLVACIEASSVSAMARAIGVSPAAISQWRTVPLDYVPHMTKLTGLPPWVLRPDYFVNLTGCSPSNDEVRAA